MFTSKVFKQKSTFLINTKKFALLKRTFSTEIAHKQFQPIVKKPLTLSENIIKYGAGLLLSPFVIFTVPNNHSHVIMRFGKYERTAYEGLRFSLPVGAQN